MTLDIKNFLLRLEEGKPTSAEIARLVEEEIAKAENLMIGFAEEVEREPVFVSQTLRQIGDYVLHLQDLQKWFPKSVLPEDQLSAGEYEDGPMVQDKIAALLRDLTD